MTKLPARCLAAALSVAVAVSAVGAQAPIRLRAVLPAYREPIALDTIMLVTPQAARAGAVWAAAEKVFYDIKVPTDTRDSARGIIGVIHYNKSGYLVDKPMSALLNCGMSITGPNADNFRISVVIMAMVMPASDSTARLGMSFIGSGLDMRGNSSDPVACASSGRLETDFADRVKKRLAAKP